MAPVSQLLVYYVTSQGEPVSDVISFDVKLLQRQVSSFSYLFIYMVYQKCRNITNESNENKMCSTC